MTHSRIVVAAADLEAEAASIEAACVLVTSTAAVDAVTMKRFFFDLTGEFPAREVLGPYVHHGEATGYPAFIAHRIGAERLS